MAAKANNYEGIVRDIKAGRYAPVYYLMGDEAYYIDRISQYIVDSVLQPEARDFNLDVLYAGDVGMDAIVERARTYPMMAENRVVVVREAQGLRNLDLLEAYLKQPSPTTLLVFCHKNGKLDARRNVAKAIQQKGVLFESRKLYDRELPSFVKGYVERSGAQIEPKAVQMLCEHVGNDLNRLSAEIDKLLSGLLGERRVIDAGMVELLTGMSKDFNSFELVGALARKDVAVAFRIVRFFQGNPRSFSLPQTLSNIFTFFSDVMMAFYSPDRSGRGLAEWLGKPEWKISQEVLPATRNYSGTKVMQILGEIRRTDGASKGVGGCRTAPGDLLQELVFIILH